MIYATNGAGSRVECSSATRFYYFASEGNGEGQGLGSSDDGHTQFDFNNKDKAFL